MWISTIRRRKADGSTWVPSKWDRVCGRHFQSGRTHPEAAHPDFTPNVQLGYPTSSSLSVRETSLQEEARQGSSESPPLVSPRIRRSERARERCRRPRLCLLSRRANATGKLEWRWQRCVRTLSSIIRTYTCSSSLDAESTTDHSKKTRTIMILVAIKLNQVNSRSRQGVVV